MTALWLAVGALATYYAALVVAEEPGPWGGFARARRRLVPSRLDSRGRFCVVCVSAWAAALVTALEWWALRFDAALAPVVWLALAGGAVKIYQFWRRE